MLSLGYVAVLHRRLSAVFRLPKEVNSMLKMPNVAILLDVPVDTTLKRSPPHKKRQRTELLEGVRVNFLKIAKERSLHMVDAMQPVEEVAREIREAVKDRVKRGD